MTRRNSTDICRRRICSGVFVGTKGDGKGVREARVVVGSMGSKDSKGSKSTLSSKDSKGSRGSMDSMNDLNPLDSKALHNSLERSLFISTFKKKPFHFPSPYQKAEIKAHNPIRSPLQPIHFSKPLFHTQQLNPM